MTAFPAARLPIFCRAPVLAQGLVLLLAAAAPHSAGADTRIEAYYQADILHNSSGGIDTGTAYLDDAGLSIDAGIRSLFGDGDARAFATLLYNNATNFSARFVGDLQTVSNIDADEAVRIYELWYEQDIAENLSLRFGLYDLNAEFDAIESAGLFLNSSHGIGAEYGQSGEAGPSIFPVTSLAARFEWQFSARSSLRYAILDGVPGDPDDPSRTTIELGDGVLHALEFDHQSAGGRRFGIGAWQYSAAFDLIETGGTPRRDDGNRGVYGFVESPLRLGPRLDATGFLRYGVADDRINPLEAYLGAGLVMGGLIDSRPGDRLGIALAHARVGRPFRRAAAADGIRSDRHETTLELSYSAPVSDWLRLQPMLQVVLNPGAVADRDAALVLGLRFELRTSRP